MVTEDILAAIETVLTGLTTSGANVQREQAYGIEQNEMPALVIYEGEDVVEQELLQSYIDWSLTVDIDLVARNNQATVITQLNTMRNEVHTALMADYTLGQTNIVKFISAVRTERPVLSVEGDRPIARQRLTYEVKYRSNWANFD